MRKVTKRQNHSSVRRRQKFKVAPSVSCSFPSNFFFVLQRFDQKPRTFRRLVHNVIGTNVVRLVLNVLLCVALLATCDIVWTS